MDYDNNLNKSTHKTAPIILEKININSSYSADFSQNHNPISDLVEISIVTSGNGQHSILNDVTDCHKGDIYIINNGVTHNYFTKGEDDFLEVLTLSFNPKTLFSGKRCDSNSPQYCYGIFRDNVPISYAMLNSSSLNEIINICESIDFELNAENHENHDAALAYLTLLLITIARYINLADTALPSQSKELAIVTAAIREIYARCNDDNMTLESISSSLFISKSHLSRLFQKVVGETFLDYVRKVRISKACDLLQYSTLTNEEIVGKCGLKDVPTFYRQFKSVIGMTPHQYRTTKNNAEKINFSAEADILTNISKYLQNGKIEKVKELVDDALKAQIPPTSILNDGLLLGMNSIAEKFKNNEIYVPTVLVAAKAMNLGLEILKPYLLNENTESLGSVCIGTVKGDLHDIGKNLVKTMLQSKGLNVIDLGIDVAPETFVEKAIEHNCKVICCSALLTTTMGVMEDIVECAKNAGIRDKVKILIGGAPITEDFCKKIGADKYTDDAATAAEEAYKYCR